MSITGRSVRKTLYTLSINDYAPDITEMTFPLMKRWAHKIGAEFQIITERKFPHLPIPMEKLQIHELGKENDWSIFLDADCCVHPDMFDPTNHLRSDTVAHYANDMAGHRWRYDKYFRRDGRHIGSCNWCAIAPKDCHDLWHPLDLTYEEAVANIFPVQVERVSGCLETDHLLDDYTLSRNIAKFGLKFKTIVSIIEELKSGSGWLWHLYNIPHETKVRMIYELLTTPPSVRPGQPSGWGLMDRNELTLKELWNREYEMLGEREMKRFSLDYRKETE